MALFEGNYEIIFHVDSFSEDRKEQFVEFIKKWRADHPFKYDNWIENLDYDSFKSVLWGGNDPDNIEDLHSFLLDAAKEFPELGADGDGNGDDIASGSWKTEYKFLLKNGVLKWDENEWSSNSKSKGTRRNSKERYHKQNRLLRNQPQRQRYLEKIPC